MANYGSIKVMLKIRLIVLSLQTWCEFLLSSNLSVYFSFSGCLNFTFGYRWLGISTDIPNIRECSRRPICRRLFPQTDYKTNNKIKLIEMIFLFSHLPEIVEDVTGTPSPLDLLYQAVDDDLNAISFDKHPSLQGDSQNGYDKNPAQSDGNAEHVLRKVQ